MPEITETLYVAGPREWRSWLQKNHDQKQEIWLVLPKKTSGRPRISYNDAVEQALCFGWIDSIQKTLDEENTVQRFTPRKIKGQYSQPNLERLRHLAQTGQLLPSVLQEVESELQKPFVFPDDIMAALKKHPLAYKNFQAFSPTYQRIRVAYVDGARKRPEEFHKRLQNFIAANEQNKQIGFGGIDKYY